MIWLISVSLSNICSEEPFSPKSTLAAPRKAIVSGTPYLLLKFILLTNIYDLLTHVMHYLLTLFIVPPLL